MRLPFKNVIVPIDGSPTARRAIDVAGPDTHVRFCSVVDTENLAYAAGMSLAMDPAPVMDELENAAELAVSDAVERAKRRGVAATGSVLRGAVVPAVELAAHETPCDAIVTATHGRTGFQRAFFGSFTESFMQSSTVPVIVTHLDDEPAPPGPITVAVDSSKASREAVAIALRIARSNCQSLSIVSVVEPDHDANESACVLDEVGEQVRDTQIDFELVTLHGPAPETIVESARRRGSALIVMGTNGRSTLARAFVGSVAAAVVERARVPVAVVRPGAAGSR